MEKPIRRKRHRPVAESEPRTPREAVPGRLPADADARRRARERAGSDDY